MFDQLRKECGYTIETYAESLRFPRAVAKLGSREGPQFGTVRMRN